MLPLIQVELTVQVHVERLPEGVYLATSEELPGLVAQGRTVAETLEIARDVARKLIEARREREGPAALPSSEECHDFRIVVGA
jgi:predicted RNase H-like HicB family nuclease